MATQETTKRVSIYAAPDALNKLKYDWLDLGVWDSKRKVSNVLEQLGLSGDVTVYQNSPNELTFIQEMETAFVMHFFTPEEQKREFTRCYIPGFTKEYDHSFALINGNCWYFYRLDLNNSLITPCFATIRYNDGIVCEEIPPYPGKCKVSFVAEQPFGCVSIATITIDNSPENISKLDRLSPQLLHKLKNGNSKDVFNNYQGFKNILGSIVSKYEITYYNESKKVTDSICATGNQVTTFTLTFDGKTISANIDGTWIMTSDIYTIKRKEYEVEFNSSATKDDYKEIDTIYNITDWVENFIEENMNFVFNL